jgi:cytochrome c551/c552
MKIWILGAMFVCGWANPLGEMFFEGNCVTCHHPTEAISAPSALQIQTQYKAALPSKKAFTAFMVQWIQNPDPATALMPEAIKQFDIMPGNLGYDTTTLEEIATYLYDVRFESP